MRIIKKGMIPDGQKGSGQLTFVAYARMLVDDGRALGQQQDIIQQWAHLKGYMICEMVFDEVALGSKRDRVGLQKALQKVTSSPEIDGLMAKKHFASASDPEIFFGPTANTENECKNRTSLLLRCFVAELERIHSIARTRDHCKARKLLFLAGSRRSPFGMIFCDEDTWRPDAITEFDITKINARAPGCTIYVFGVEYELVNKSFPKPLEVLNGLKNLGIYRNYRDSDPVDEAGNLMSNIKSYVRQQQERGTLADLRAKVKAAIRRRWTVGYWCAGLRLKLIIVG
ncbi:hypothetical protein HK101_009120 [Irineochytrium annulatum]|nr:hypothetical protein HK101_009120 [Irineochytrium annulatum]